MKFLYGRIYSSKIIDNWIVYLREHTMMKWFLETIGQRARQILTTYLGAWIFFCSVSISLSVSAQSLYISKYVGSGEAGNANHQIDIFNESFDPVSLGGYFLFTRNYIVRIPEGTVIGSLKSLRLGHLSTNRELDIEYLGGSVNDFYVRAKRGRELGDFVVLFSPQLRIVDAFYFGPSREVSYLPAIDQFTSYGRTAIPMRVPDERSAYWTYFQINPDPSFAYVKVNGQWRINSRKPGTNLVPSTKYDDIQVSYVNGLVTLKWQTAFERDCYYHTVERSENGADFRIIEQKRAHINTDFPQEYKIYDETTEEGKFYYYQVRTRDKFSSWVSSKLARVHTSNGYGKLSMDLITRVQPTGKPLNVRFNADEIQRVRVKILDEEFREVDVLFYGIVEAEQQHLIQYDNPLPIGKYFLIADTPEEREYIEFIIGKNREVTILK